MKAFALTATLFFGSTLYAADDFHVAPNNNSEIISAATSLLNSTAKGDTDGINELIEKGVDLNVRDINSQTLLHFAVKGNHIPTIKVLLAKDADVNATNKSDRTPLAVANEKAVKLLLKEGAQ